MKILPPRVSLALAIISLFCPIAAQADTSMKFSGEQAKVLYNYLTGSSVQSEGAAGHLYRVGKALSCRYTNVDMSDRQGKAIPQEDPRRYYCGMKVDHEGFVSVSNTY